MTAIPFVDRRASADTDELVQAGDEERHSRRRHIRDVLLPAARQRQEHIASVTQELTLCESEVTAAVARHGATCEPLQERLAAATGAERSEIRSQIDDANDALELELQRIRRRQKLFVAEREKLQAEPGGNPTVLKNQLVNLASPQLLAAKFATEQAVWWAKERTAFAAKKVEQYESLLDSERRKRHQPTFGFDGTLRHRELPPTKNEPIYQSRLEKWTAELAAAREAHAEAVQQSNRARQACLDE